jgi:hypothetical protein
MDFDPKIDDNVTASVTYRFAMVKKPCAERTPHPPMGAKGDAVPTCARHKVFGLMRRHRMVIRLYHWPAVLTIKTCSQVIHNGNLTLPTSYTGSFW